MSENAVSLTGTVTAIDALRHTPAGVPIVSFSLRHDSSQWEADTARRTAFDIAVTAVGEVASAASRLHIGERISVNGFIAARARKGVQVGRELILHVTNFTSL